MQILHLCPANLASGGPEGIHNLVHHLNKVGADAKILYVGNIARCSQPKEYEKYECRFITTMPRYFDGCVIFPEVWANQAVDAKYDNCLTAVNWQGVDVFYWHNGNDMRFMQRKNMLHIANSEYAVEHLRKLGLDSVKISDCLNDAFFETMENQNRDDVILYNPTECKLTDFQKTVMKRCRKELNVEFKPIQGYTREALIAEMCRHKLYIDFGVFSGRERLPREAVMCGCCILTSNKGTARFYEDNSITEMYKVDNVEDAIYRINYILKNYDTCVRDFDEYRRLLQRDKQNYMSEVKNLYGAILNYHSSI